MRFSASCLLKIPAASELNSTTKKIPSRDHGDARLGRGVCDVCGGKLGVSANPVSARSWDWRDSVTMNEIVLGT